MSLQKLNREKSDHSEKMWKANEEVEMSRIDSGVKSATTATGKLKRTAGKIYGKVRDKFYMTEDEYAEKQFRKVKSTTPKVASPETIVDLGDDGKINRSYEHGGVVINVNAQSPQEQVQLTPPKPENFAQKLKSIGGGVQRAARGMQEFGAKHGSTTGLNDNASFMGNPNMRDPLAGLNAGLGNTQLSMLGGGFGGGGMKDPLAGLTGGFGGRRGRDPLAGLSGGFGGKRRGDPLAGLCGFGCRGKKDPLAMLSGASGIKRKKIKKKKRRY